MQTNPLSFNFSGQYIDPEKTHSLIEKLQAEKSFLEAKIQAREDFLVHTQNTLQPKLDRQANLKKQISDMAATMSTTARQIPRDGELALQRIRGLTEQISQLQNEMTNVGNIKTRRKRIQFILDRSPADIQEKKQRVEIIHADLQKLQPHYETISSPEGLLRIITENRNSGTSIISSSHTWTGASTDYEPAMTPEASHDTPDSLIEEPAGHISLAMTTEDYLSLIHEYEHVLIPRLIKIQKEITICKEKIKEFEMQKSEKHRAIEANKPNLDQRIENYKEKKAEDPKAKKPKELTQAEAIARVSEKEAKNLQNKIDQNTAHLKDLEKNLEETEIIMKEVRSRLRLQNHIGPSAPEPLCSYTSQLELLKRHPDYAKLDIASFVGHGPDRHFFGWKKSGYAICNYPEWGAAPKEMNWYFLSQIPLLKDRAWAFREGRAIHGYEDGKNDLYTSLIWALTPEARADKDNLPACIGWTWRLHELTMIIANSNIAHRYLETPRKTIPKPKTDAIQTEREKNIINWIYKFHKTGYIFLHHGDSEIRKQSLEAIRQQTSVIPFIAINRFVIDTPLAHLIRTLLRKRHGPDTTVHLTSVIEDNHGKADLVYFIPQKSEHETGSHLAAITRKVTGKLGTIDMTFQREPKKDTTGFLLDYQKHMNAALKSHGKIELTPHEFHLHELRSLVRTYLDWYWGCVEQYGEVHDDWTIQKWQTIDTDGQLEKLVANIGNNHKEEDQETA